MDRRRTEGERVNPGAPRRLAAGSGPCAIPLGPMLALSAAARAVGAAADLASAIAILEREAARLGAAADATVVVLRGAPAAWWRDGAVIGQELQELASRIARTGQRGVYGATLVEPIGAAPARAVLALRRPSGAAFTADDVALIGALAGGVAATLQRLLGVAARASRPALP